MPNELKAIKQWIKSADLKANLNIDYLCCGIWNYETISSLEHYLTENDEPTFIWNIWICGYRNPKNEKRSDPIQISNIINIHTEKEMIIPPFLQIAPLKTCICSESVVYEKPTFENKIWTTDDEMYFDMESRWIEFIASKHKYPRLILKVPFDLVWNNETIKSNWFRHIMYSISESLYHLNYNIYLQKIINRADLQNL